MKISHQIMKTTIVWVLSHSSHCVDHRRLSKSLEVNIQNCSRVCHQSGATGSNKSTCQSLTGRCTFISTHWLLTRFLLFFDHTVNTFFRQSCGFFSGCIRYGSRITCNFCWWHTSIAVGGVVLSIAVWASIVETEPNVTSRTTRYLQLETLPILVFQFWVDFFSFFFCINKWFEVVEFEDGELT